MQCKFLPVAAALALAAVFSQGLLGQCDLISAHGIYDTSNSLSDEQRAAAFRNWFCQQRFESSSQAEAASGAFQYDILNLGYSQKSQSWAQFYSSYCSDVSFQESYRRRTIDEIRRINPGVVAALEHCLSQPGLHARVEQGIDARVFRFIAVFKPSTQYRVISEVNTFQLLGGICEPMLHPRDSIAPQGRELLCQRTGEGAVEIVFTADDLVIKDTPLFLPGLSDPKPVIIPSPPCVEELLSARKPVIAARHQETAANVVDGDVSTVWNSGSEDPVWIEIDLEGAHELTAIELYNEGYPMVTTEQITGELESGQRVILAEFQQASIGGAIITTHFPVRQRPMGIRKVRVSTLQRNGWVAWQEIKILGCR